MSMVTEAVSKAFGPEKMNYELLEMGDAHLYDGMITISRACFVEPEIHEKIKKMPSGRKKVISKRIPISVDYGKMLEEGLIKVENCSNCWQVTEGKMHIDVMVCHILFYVFRKYQEEGKIPEHISYNV